MRIRFQPSGREMDVEEGASLLEAAIRASETTVECCGKKTLCGLCKVSVLDGVEHTNRPEALEDEFRKRRRFLPFERLGCMTTAHGDVEVELAR